MGLNGQKWVTRVQIQPKKFRMAKMGLKKGPKLVKKGKKEQNMVQKLVKMGLNGPQ